MAIKIAARGPGGGILIAKPVACISEMVKSEHFKAANAVGAAIGRISVGVDRVYAQESRSGRTRSTRRKARRVKLGSEFSRPRRVPLSYGRGR